MVHHSLTLHVLVERRLKFAKLKKMHTTLKLVLAVAILSAVFAQQEQTNALIKQLITTYGEKPVNDLFGSCVTNRNCSACTSNSGCVWVSGSTIVGLYVRRVADKTNIIATQDTNFCWQGNGAGVSLNNVPAQTLAKEDTVVSVTAGFNDVSWAQCGLKQGGVLAVAIIVPIAVIVIIACLSICVCICCYRLRRKWSKEDREKMVPREEKKKNWLGRRK